VAGPAGSTRRGGPTPPAPWHQCRIGHWRALTTGFGAGRPCRRRGALRRGGRCIERGPAKRWASARSIAGPRAAAELTTSYEQPSGLGGDPKDVLVISVDGKGIVMRRGTAKATRKGPDLPAQDQDPPVQAKSTGESAWPSSNGLRRHPGHAAPPTFWPERTKTRQRTRRQNKWLTASVVETRQCDQAGRRGTERRTPSTKRTWVGSGRGNSTNRPHRKEAARRKMKITSSHVIHVLEYLWTAAWCLR